MLVTPGTGDMSNAVVNEKSQDYVCKQLCCVHSRVDPLLVTKINSHHQPNQEVAFPSPGPKSCSLFLYFSCEHLFDY